MPIDATLDMPRPTPDPETEALTTCPVFGFNFVSETDLGPIVERILGPQPTDDLLPLVITPNVDYIVRLEEPGLVDLAEPLRRARYILPDGQPIVWTSRFVGDPLAARLAGSSLFPLIWNRIVHERRSVVVVASTPRTAEMLQREHPGAGIVVPAQFDADDEVQLGEVVDACAEAIAAVDAEFVLIGISFPKQQRIALALLERLRRAGQPVPLFLMLGGSFEMYLGQVKRAPEWMQRTGTEWFFRFLNEPRRLFRRYFITDTRFLGCMIREFVRTRRGRRQRSLSQTA